ncbi:MAG: cytosine permease, partial [Flavobacteriales bacterium]
MKEEIVELKEDMSSSPLYNEDLAPVPKKDRTWTIWSLASLWVGMAVCIPTYLLASNIIISGISWWAALIIIGLANLIITIPMVLSGHGGVKYGIPVLARSSFGHHGVHIPALIRGFIAAVWFGIQCWIGGISIYSIWCAITGADPVSSGLTEGQFVGFFVFWLINVFFIVKGTESIKVLEMVAAPILLLMGIALIGWGSNKASFSSVLEQGSQLMTPSTVLVANKDKEPELTIRPLKDLNNKVKGEEYQLTLPVKEGED